MILICLLILSLLARTVSTDDNDFNLNKILKCRPGFYMAHFSYRYNSKRIGIGCRVLEDCKNDTNCSFAASCKNSRLMDKEHKDKIFVAGVMPNGNPSILRVFCCQSHTYEFKNCVSKEIRFGTNLHISISKILRKYKNNNEKIIADIEITGVRGRNGQKLNTAMITICTRRKETGGICPADRREIKDKNTKENGQRKSNNPSDQNNQQIPENAKESPDTIDGKDVPNLQENPIPHEIQMTEEKGTSALKWMPAAIAGPVAGAATGVGLYIGLNMNACQKFVIEDPNIEVVFDPYDFNDNDDLVPIGAIATVTCEEPTTLKGPETLECISRFMWDYDEVEYPYCAKVCENYTVEYSDTIEYTNMYSDTEIKSGGTGNVTCKLGYDLDPPNLSMSTCNDGTWTDIPECVLGNEICPYDKSMDVWGAGGLPVTYYIYNSLTAKVEAINSGADCADLCLENKHIDRCAFAVYNGEVNECFLLAYETAFQETEDECYKQVFPYDDVDTDDPNALQVNSTAEYGKRCNCNESDESVYALELQRDSCKESVPVVDIVNSDCLN